VTFAAKHKLAAVTSLQHFGGWNELRKEAEKQG
jgi:hypothetical protein